MADTVKMNMSTDASNEILKHLNYSNNNNSNNNDDDESAVLVTNSKQSQVYTCLADDQYSGVTEHGIQHERVAVTIDTARQLLLNKLHLYHEDNSKPILRVILHDDLVLQTLRICETLNNKPSAVATTGHTHCLLVGQQGQGITVSYIRHTSHRICYAMCDYHYVLHALFDSQTHALTSS
jgi:hypothetical protein